MFIFDSLILVGNEREREKKKIEKKNNIQGVWYVNKPSGRENRHS